jgi:hypothetical protein
MQTGQAHVTRNSSNNNNNKTTTTPTPTTTSNNNNINKHNYNNNNNPISLCRGTPDPLFCSAHVEPIILFVTGVKFNHPFLCARRYTTEHIIFHTLLCTKFSARGAWRSTTLQGPSISS